ncbi:MAG: DUF6992 family protein [Candidatus Kapaibacteriota bacterium]
MIILLLSICCTESIFSMTSDSVLQSYNMERISIQKTGMQILGTWALTNIIAGGIASSKSQGETSAFWQMNAGWNIINAGIAGIGYFTQSMPNTLAGTVAEQHSIETLLAVNTGLDIAYILGGLYLREKAHNSEQSERLRGFGNAIMMQGAFLLLFDAALYAVNAHHGKTLESILQSVSISSNGIGMHISF